MNQSLISLELHSVDSINRFYDYETCRQQSSCYLLLPPPRPPILPKLTLTNPSLSVTNLHQRMNSLLIIFALLITLFSTFALLFYLNFKQERMSILSQMIDFYLDFNSMINYNNVIVDEKISIQTINLRPFQV